MNLDAFNDSSSTLPSTPKGQFLALKLFSIVILCFFIGHVSRSCFLTFLALDLTDTLNWPTVTIALWYGFLVSGTTFTFIGGFLGDRTIKRKNWIWIGLLVQGIGILLFTTHTTSAVKVGLVLFFLGSLLFQGNILVVVADYAVAARIRLETAFLIVFFSANFGGIFTPLSGFLFDDALLYPVLTLVTITSGLLLLLVTRTSSVNNNPDYSLNHKSNWRRRVVLIVAFLVTRGLSYSGLYAFNWSEGSENASEGIVAIFGQMGSFPLIVSIASLLLVPLIVLFIIRWLRRGNSAIAGVQLISLGLAATGIGLIVVGLCAGDLLPKHQNLLAVVIVLMSVSVAFLFVAMVTLACTLVRNRWRGTVTALFAGVPASVDITLLSWERWPLAAPLFIAGTGILVASLLWHLLVVGRLAKSLIIPKAI